MLKNAFALGLAAALVAGSALAAGGEKPKKDVGQYVDISPVALPIVVNGTLVNYVFINVRIMLSTQANVVKLREKEPYFRDALVRAGHRSPFTKADDYNVVDAARMKATLLREAQLIAGARDIVGINIINQAPKRQMARPATVVGRNSPEIRP
jgi:hypothetical protein